MIGDFPHFCQCTRPERTRPGQAAHNVPMVLTGARRDFYTAETVPLPLACCFNASRLDLWIGRSNLTAWPSSRELRNAVSESVRLADLQSEASTAAAAPFDARAWAQRHHW